MKGGCGRVTLKHHKALLSCLSWLCLQHFLGLSKSLFFQSSGKVDFYNFCLFFPCFYEEWIPFSAIFANITTESLYTDFFLLFIIILSIQQIFIKYLLCALHIISTGDKVRMKTNALLYWSIYSWVCWWGQGSFKSKKNQNVYTYGTVV